jgi:hypothetical protein
MEKLAGLGFLKDIVGATTGMYGVQLGATALAGIGGGYGLAKLLSPESLTDDKSMDRELIREALSSEIDATERRIAALQRRRDELARKRSERPYDRFV